MTDKNLTHQLKCVYGTYKCTEKDCNFESLNVVTAKAHFADNNNLDYELEDLF